MKIKSIARICKKNKTLVVAQPNGDDAQYIGNGHALYAVRGLPRMNADELLRMFDVKEAERDNWYKPEGWAMQPYSVEDNTEEEEILRANLPAIMYLGDLLTPLETEAGEIYFIDKTLIAPVGEEMTGYYLRRTQGGEPYIVIKEGFMFAAIVMPCMMISQEFCDSVKRLWQGCYRMAVRHENEGI